MCVSWCLYRLHLLGKSPEVEWLEKNICGFELGWSLAIALQGGRTGIGAPMIHGHAGFPRPSCRLWWLNWYFRPTQGGSGSLVKVHQSPQKETDERLMTHWEERCPRSPEPCKGLASQLLATDRRKLCAYKELVTILVLRPLLWEYRTGKGGKLRCVP